MSIFYLKQNDTQPKMLASLKDGNGDAIDLTNASVRFYMRTLAGTKIVDDAASIAAAATGLVRYDWQPADTAEIGSYQAEFEVTYPDGTIETFPNDGYIRVEIADDIA